MKWTGHSDFTAMKPYVAIVDGYSLPFREFTHSHPIPGASHLR